MTHSITVWDRFVRLFHWSLVVLFATSYLTGENEHWFHIYSGYTITALIGLRVIWGFVGSKHARFKDFVTSPTTVLTYLRSIAGGNPKRYLGHNPAGGAMIILLLVTLLGTTLSGMKLLAIEENKGPFSVVSAPTLIQPAYADNHEYDDHSDEYREYDDDTHDESKDSESENRHSEKHHEEEEFWEEIHEVCISLMLLFITLHVVGVIVASRQHNESLVKAMITGQKEQDL